MLPPALAQPRNSVPLFARRYARWMFERRSIIGVLVAYAVFMAVIVPPMFVIGWWRGRARIVSR